MKEMYNYLIYVLNVPNPGFINLANNMTYIFYNGLKNLVMFSLTHEVFSFNLGQRYKLRNASKGH